MRLTYTVMTSPDSEKPNQQSEGNTISDDRIFMIDKERITLTVAQGAFNCQSFTKNLESNLLTCSAASWVNGDIIVLDY